MIAFLRRLFCEREGSWEGSYLTMRSFTARMVGGLILGAALIIGSLAFVGAEVDVHTCDVRAAGLHLDYEWSIFAGCRVRLPDGRLVDIDTIRFTEGGKLEAAQ